MGQGVAHDTQGNIYFIPGALPGDRILAETVETSKRYRDAELVEVLAPSPDRRDPECAVFHECGGCDWLHWDYAAQVAAKEKTLRHVLERSTWLPEKFLPTITANETMGYRNRIQLHAAGGRLGFYRRKSHDVVDIASCPVAHPKLNASLAELRREPESLAGGKIELFVQEDGGVGRRDNEANAAAGFAQVHDAQNALLRQAIGQLVLGAEAKNVLELFAGNGNLTFEYLSGVEEVIAIDSSPTALQQARERLKAFAGKRAAFIEANVDVRLKRRLPREFMQGYDTLLLDPPRAGAEGCLEPLCFDGLQTIIYVSCNPVAFTKDVQCLNAQFDFRQVQIIDMFPHTRHIEFIALFSRRAS